MHFIVLFIFCFILNSLFGFIEPLYSDEINYPTTIKVASSPHPLGSGARAIAMGCAYISIADDATAASWNPGGLIRVKDREFSIVWNYIHRKETNHVYDFPESSNVYRLSEEYLNYMSLTYPFMLWKRNMVISLNYQHLYDFSRSWNFPLNISGYTNMGYVDLHSNVIYSQDGGLSAIGLAYCIQFIKSFSMGITLNIWDHHMSQNKWEESYDVNSTIFLNGIHFTQDHYHAIHRYTFEGYNVNAGILWMPDDYFTLGIVFKSPFKAKIQHEVQTNDFIANTDETLQMPMSFGFGLSYRFSDHFTLAADFYRTEWQHFVFEDSDGSKTSPITGEKIDNAEINPTHQSRIGAEYLISNKHSAWTFPLKAGLFYDPSPARGNSDDFYGISLGSGISGEGFEFDFAYQFRKGNSVSHSLVQGFDHFSQDVREHNFFFSFVFHLD